MKYKSYIISLGILSAMAACTKSPENKNHTAMAQQTESSSNESSVQNSDQRSKKEELSTSEKPKYILSNYDCYSCHQDNETLIGPSFKTIANRTADKTNALDYLADKIKKGSVGTYGQIPMQPHNFIPDNEIKQICNYILNLK